MPFIETAWSILESVAWLWGKRKKSALLIIDDNDDDGFMLGALLSRLGYQFQIETTAEAGLALLKTGKHKLVFVDIRLPMMSGIALLDKLRLISPKTHVVIVAGTSGDLEELKTNHYIGVMVKPVTLEALEDCLSKTVK